MSDRCQHRRGVYHFNSQAGKGKPHLIQILPRAFSTTQQPSRCAFKEDLRLKTITPMQFRSDSILNFDLEFLPMVGGVGFEPTHPKGPDLQSGAALQLDRPPKYISSLLRSLFKPAYLTHLVSGLRPAGYANSLRDNINYALSKYMSNLSFDYLPVCARPGWNPDRLDTSRRIVKTGPVQAPVLGGSIRHARTFALALFNKKVIYTQQRLTLLQQ